MGYACPVCSSPQADGEHLANHLAFTALTSGGEHETWLDEHVPEWGQLGEAELADEVTDDATETEFPQVFEASGDGRKRGARDHDGDAQDGRETSAADARGVDVAAARERADGELDEETRAIVEEARKLTRERRGDDAEVAGGAEPTGGAKAAGDAEAGDPDADDESASTSGGASESETE